MATDHSPSSAVQVLVAVVRRHGVAPGTVAGTVVYLHTGRLWHALVLACLAGSPTEAAQRVIAEWIGLLRPPKSWRRPRRHGS